MYYSFCISLYLLLIAGIFCWIPSQLRIKANELADQTAESGISLSTIDCIKISPDVFY